MCWSWRHEHSSVFLFGTTFFTHAWTLQVGVTFAACDWGLWLGAQFLWWIRAPRRLRRSLQLQMCGKSFSSCQNQPQIGSRHTGFGGGPTHFRKSSSWGPFLIPCQTPNSNSCERLVFKTRNKGAEDQGECYTWMMEPPSGTLLQSSSLNSCFLSSCFLWIGIFFFFLHCGDNILEFCSNCTSFEKKADSNYAGTTAPYPGCGAHLLFPFVWTCEALQPPHCLNAYSTVHSRTVILHDKTSLKVRVNTSGMQLHKFHANVRGIQHFAETGTEK